MRITCVLLLFIVPLLVVLLGAFCISGSAAVFDSKKIPCGEDDAENEMQFDFGEMGSRRCRKKHPDSGLEGLLLHIHTNLKNIWYWIGSVGCIFVPFYIWWPRFLKCAFWVLLIGLLGLLFWNIYQVTKERLLDDYGHAARTVVQRDCRIDKGVTWEIIKHFSGYRQIFGEERDTHCIGSNDRIIHELNLPYEWILGHAIVSTWRSISDNISRLLETFETLFGHTKEKWLGKILD